MCGILATEGAVYGEQVRSYTHTHTNNTRYVVNCAPAPHHASLRNRTLVHHMLYSFDCSMCVNHTRATSMGGARIRALLACRGSVRWVTARAVCSLLCNSINDVLVVCVCVLGGMTLGVSVDTAFVAQRQCTLARRCAYLQLDEEGIPLGYGARQNGLVVQRLLGLRLVQAAENRHGGRDEVDGEQRRTWPA